MFGDSIQFSTCSTLISNTAPTVDEVLTPDDAVEVLEELLDAQSQSYVLGLKLKLPLPVVDAIFSTYAEPRDRLLQVIIAFTRQVENPTWRAIADALRSPALNLISLANRVEAAHIPDPTATRDREPETALTGPGIMTYLYIIAVHGFIYPVPPLLPHSHTI